MREYRERFFRSGALRIHFRDWGNPDNPPLVIVHGLRDHSHSFDDLSRELSRDYRVYSIDLRGHGDSESTPYYAFGHFVGDIRNMIRALRLERPIVIGHSFGGEIVGQWAATFTDVARHAGVTNDRYAKGVTAGDYDNDGDLDLYVSNAGKNRLYRNNADGTFTDVADQLGVAEPIGGGGHVQCEKPLKRRERGKGGEAQQRELRARGACSSWRVASSL